MSITYYMLQISPVMLFFITIVGSGFLAGISTYIFRKKIQIKILRSHNEVTGFLFLAIASFYALLLSFVVLIVWDQLNETHNNASKEGSSALGLYRDIKFYPDTMESKKLMVAYLDFVYNVIDDEFPNMQKMQSSTKTSSSFNNVSGGDRSLIPAMAKAAIAVGIAGVFIEVHDNPDNAPVDGLSSLNLNDLKALLEKLKKIDEIVKTCVKNVFEEIKEKSGS